MDKNHILKSGIEEIFVTSSIDGSKEPNLVWKCFLNKPAPLLVGLHTWSNDRYNLVESLYPLVKKNLWHLLLPEFRGPNLKTNPRATQACASHFAMQDVVDAVEKVCSMFPVDREKIFLFGGSGGGHMALMLAGYRPDLWCSVASFCGITDLIAWHFQNPNYSPHIEACCGGPPTTQHIDEYKKRSPLFHAEKIAKCKEVYIYHGKFDKSVPFTHATILFNEISKIAPSSRVFLYVFDGGHDVLMERAEKQFLNASEKKITATG